MESVFIYLRNKRVDFERNKNEAGKWKGNSLNNGKKDKSPLTANKIKR